MSKESENIIYTRNLVTGYVTGKGFIPVPRFPVNISARKGDLIALIGINGSGKTTLLKALSGLHPVKSGDVNILNLNPGNAGRLDFAKVLSIGTTDPVKVAYTTVFDFVSLGRFPYAGFFGRLNDSDNEIINKAIDETGLNYKKDAIVSQLSDGEKQRVMIARTLAQDTPVILFDEPTAYLDIPNKYEILNLLKNLTEKYQKTILFSTHDLQAALQISDRIWLLTGTGLMNKIPEQLIMDGDLKKGFNTPKVHFDEDLTNFVFSRNLSQMIGLTGKGKNFNITFKALSRIGYNVVSNKKDKLYVIIDENENSIKGQLFIENECINFNQLEELLIMIKDLKFKL